MRITGTDLDGTKKLSCGLIKIKGVGKRISDVIIKVTGLNPEMLVGNLTDNDLRKLEKVIKEPLTHGVPVWLLNRRKDLETGKDYHLTGSDLTLSTRKDIKLKIDTRSWKGFRHSHGLKVRGQKTRTTGRKGRVVGVKKRSLRRKA